jgi:hypothetical protein
VNQRGKVTIVAESEPIDDVRAALATAAIAAMTLRTELLEQAAARLSVRGDGRLP